MLMVSGKCLLAPMSALVAWSMLAKMAEAHQLGDRIVAKFDVDVIDGGKKVDQIPAGVVLQVLDVRRDGQELLVSNGVRGWIAADSALPLNQSALDYFQKEIAARPGNAKLFHARAQLLRAAGQLDAARDSCNLAIGYDPELAVAYVTRGDCHQDQGKLKEAIAEYDVAIAKAPSLPIAYNNRAFAKQRLGDAQGALADYSAAIKANPLYVNAYNNRAIVHQEAGRRPEALSDYSRAIELNPNYIAALHNRGQIQYELGNFRDAVADLSDALRLSPTDPTSLEMRARTWIALQDFQRALRDFDEAIRHTASPTAELLMQRGQLHSEMRNLEAALADLDRAVALDPKHFNSSVLRAMTLQRMKRFDEADAEYERAAKLEPGDGSVALTRATVWKELGEFDRAIKELTKAIEADATLATAFMFRGQVRNEKGDFAWAIDDFNRAIRLGAKDPLAYHNRGMANVGLNNFDAAYRDFSRALELNPALKESYKNRSDLLIAAGNFPLAEADASQAIRIDPGYADAYRSRADARLMLGRHDEAQADYEHALKLVPEHSTALSGLAKVAAAKGDPKGARDRLNRAVEAAPDNLALRLERAEASLLQGDVEGALGDVDLVLGRETDNPAALVRRAHCCLLLGQYAESKKALVSLMRVDADRRAPFMSDAFMLRCIYNVGVGNTADALSDAIGVAEAAPQLAMGPFLEGMVRHLRNDFEQAAACYSVALQLDPGHVRAAVDLHSATLKIPSREVAIPDLTADFAGDEDLDAAHAKRARLRHFLGFVELAKRDYAEAIRLAPQELQYRLLRAELLEMAGDDEAAIADLSLVLSSDPNNAQAVMTRGAVLAKQGKHKDAIVDYLRASDLKTDQSLLFILMHQSYDALGDAIAARKSLDEGIERFPTDATLYIQRAAARGQSGDLAGALDDSRAALKWSPQDVGTRYMHGMYLLRNDKVAEAEAEFSRILEKAPRYAAAHMYRGQTRLRRGALTEALKDFDEVVALLGSNSFAHLGRGDVHFRNGNDEAALTEYLIAFQTESESAPLLTRIADIYSMSPQRSIRNLEESMAAAERAVSVTSQQDPAALAARGAAYAGVGQFRKAEADIEKAISLLKPAEQSLRDALSRRLERYRGDAVWEESLAERRESLPASVLDEFLRLRWGDAKR
jgi:tetratricopeptide (TPR) repeat protein